MSKHIFPCGCSLPIIEQSDSHIRLKFDPNIENLNLECEATWDLISDGNTKGVFQLESRLGQMTAKKLKPRNIEHLSALTAIIRPGCLNAKDGGKSVTDHYIDRKNGEEAVEYFHPALKPILEPTYGQMIYQESAMQIARDIAGFNLQEADTLRKSIGKKDAELMAKIKTQFIDGCKQKGIVTVEQATEIFSWIEASQRYSFNHSHSVLYAMNAYLSAYAKTHSVFSFFISYLHYAKEKQKPFDEIKDLISNAKLMDIDIWPPDFRHMNKHFSLIGRKIYFGLVDIKGFGDSAYNKLIPRVKEIESLLDKSASQWTWLEFLIYLSEDVNKTAAIGMIETGALSYTGYDRSKLIYEFELYHKLTKKEQAWIKQTYNTDKYTNMSDIIKDMVSSPTGKGKAIANVKRVTKVKEILYKLEKPAYSLEDSVEWLASVEESRLGCSITVSIIDSCDTSAANATCRDILKGQCNKNILVAGEIEEVKETVVKNGKNAGQDMAFVNFRDHTASVPGVVFSQRWDEIKSGNLCVEGNRVMLTGQYNPKKGSFIIQKIWQLT